jgi:hypothetical protein
MRVRRTLAALLAAPCLLSACGGGSSVADPPVSSHPTSSAPTIQPPAHESPEHFIRRWVAASNAMESGGSTTAYLSMTSNCMPCSALAHQISEARNNGGFYKSRGWTIKSITAVHRAGSSTVDVVVDSAPTSFRKSETAAVSHYSGGRFTFRIISKRLGESWKVTNVAQVGA